MVTGSDLTADPENANKHTERGLEALRGSLERFGAARPVLLDRHDTVIAGNATVASWGDRPVRVLDTDGREYVVVIRDDLSGDEAATLAWLDNRIAELNLAWDTPQVIAEYDTVPIKPYWRPEEIETYRAALVPTPTLPPDTTDWLLFSLEVPVPTKERWREVIGSQPGTGWCDKLAHFLETR